jgi:hypothetical protein
MALIAQATGFVFGVIGATEAPNFLASRAFELYEQGCGALAQTV